MDNIATTGVQAPAAVGQTGQGTAGGQPATIIQQPVQGTLPGGQPVVTQPMVKDVTVPLTVVEAIRRELSESKTAAGELRGKLQQFEMMQQMGAFNRPTAAVQPPDTGGQQPVVQDPLSGLEEDDLVSVRELRKIVQSMGSGDVNKALEPVHQTLARVQVQLQDPNFETTIRTYLPEMITVNPMLREMITRSSNPLSAALAVAKMSPKFMQAQQANQQGGQPQQPPDILSDLQRIIENATRPGSPGSMGGGGAISGADRFKNMTDADFDTEVNRVLSGGR